MSVPALLLSVFIVLRLLMPPGICVCKLSSPALRWFALLNGQEQPSVPAEPAEEEDDHAPGCPASYLSQGMGVAPPSGPGPFILPWTGYVATAADSPIPFTTHLVPPSADIFLPALPLQVAHCALLL
jgi:hypothetical protein